MTPAAAAPSLRNPAWSFPTAHRTFRWVWAATVVSNIGGWSQDIGEGWLALTTLLHQRPAGWRRFRPPRGIGLGAVFHVPGGAARGHHEQPAASSSLMEGWATGVTALMALMAWSGVDGAVVAPPVLIPEFGGLRAGRPGLASGHPGAGPTAGPTGRTHPQRPRDQYRAGHRPSDRGRRRPPSAGSWAAFTINAVSFAGVLIVIALWRPPRHTSNLQPERLRGAVTAGLRFALHAPTFRIVLPRTAALYGVRLGPLEPPAGVRAPRAWAGGSYVRAAAGVCGRRGDDGGPAHPATAESLLRQRARCRPALTLLAGGLAALAAPSRLVLDSWFLAMLVTGGARGSLS